METSEVARKLRGHTRQVQSLRYNDKELLAAVADLPKSVGQEMEDTFSVLRKTGSAFYGISRTARGPGLFDSKHQFTLQSYIPTTST